MQWKSVQAKMVYLNSMHLFFVDIIINLVTKLANINFLCYKIFPDFWTKYSLPQPIIEELVGEKIRTNLDEMKWYGF